MATSLSRFLAALLATLLLGFAAACSHTASSTSPAAPGSTALQKLAVGINDSAHAVAALQNTVIAANGQKLLSDQETAAILSICAKVNAAGQQASTLTRQYTTLPAGSKPTLLQIINPIVASVQNALSTGLIGITNATVKNDVQAALTTLQAALAAVQLALS